MTEDQRRIRVCLAGTWDPDFHKNLKLRRILELCPVEVSECRADLWNGPRPQLVFRGKLATLSRAFVAYLKLVWRWFRSPRPDIVLVPYPGHFDVPVLTLLARMRSVPLVFDIFISLHDTVVTDRNLLRPESVFARILRTADTLACTLSDLVIADTPAHARFFSDFTGVPSEKFRILWLGALDNLFKPHPEITPDPDLVLFHGTFIRLQGLETIIRAAKLLENHGVRFRIIGDGQERSQVDRLSNALEVRNVERLGLLPLESIPREIAGAGVCLGIFGDTAKADRVIPNKLFECIAVGRPVITADTDAARETFSRNEIVLVPAADPEALAKAILNLRARPEQREEIGRRGRARFVEQFSESALAMDLTELLRDLAKSGSSPRDRRARQGIKST